VTSGSVSHKTHRFPSSNSPLAASTWRVTAAPALPAFSGFPLRFQPPPRRSWCVTSGRSVPGSRAWLAADRDTRPVASDRPRATRPGPSSDDAAPAGCDALVDTRRAHTSTDSLGAVESCNDTRRIASWATPIRVARRLVHRRSDLARLRPSPPDPPPPPDPLPPSLLGGQLAPVDPLTATTWLRTW